MLKNIIYFQSHSRRKFARSVPTPDVNTEVVSHRVKEAERKVPKEKQKMGVIDEYLKKAGGKFLKADNVKEGDRLTIDKLWEDSETWDTLYILIEGTFSQTGEPRIARLAVQNVERVVEVLGNDETRWIGNNIRVLGTAIYPGLGSKGILWTGEKKVVQAEIAKTAPTSIDATTPLTEPPDLTGLTHKETISWLKTYNVFSGMEIPEAIWNAISTDVKSELAMRRLITRKNEKPYLHEDAGKV